MEQYINGELSPESQAKVDYIRERPIYYDDKRWAIHLFYSHAKDSHRFPIRNSVPPQAEKDSLQGKRQFPEQKFSGNYRVLDIKQPRYPSNPHLKPEMSEPMFHSCCKKKTESM